jgi:hypothetical protein
MTEIMKDVKAFAFTETLNQPLNETDTLFTIDKNKCRTYILKDGIFAYPVFTVFDTPKVYENETCPGIYFVKTDSYFPMRGTGWYYYNMIDYALSINLITKDDIKYVVKSSLSIPSNYYNKWIDHVFETLEDAKLAVNSMIGGFNYNASKHENWSSVCITKSSPAEAMEKFIENNAHFIDVLTIDEKKYYHVFKNFNSVKLESKSNIYNQILQQENIELHKMAQIIDSKGGRVLDLITDDERGILCFTKNA